LDDQGSIPKRDTDLFFIIASRPTLDSHSASYAMSITGFFLKGKADHSVPFSTKVKKAWSCISTPHVFTACCLVNYRDNFTFNLTISHYQI
jgi:hypothetical protein